MGPKAMYLPSVYKTVCGYNYCVPPSDSARRYAGEREQEKRRHARGFGVCMKLVGVLDVYVSYEPDHKKKQ